MSKEKSGPVPTEIQLHQQSRVLEIVFDNGKRFELPCRYLRAFSPSAEVTAARNRGEVIKADENINIDSIEPVGNYAVKLKFTDGHDTGIYSWTKLYELCRDHERNWEKYLQELEAAGTKTENESGPKTINVLYFVSLATQLGRENEEVVVPPAVKDVRSLITWLSRRGEQWRLALKENPLKVTVNKQFAEPETHIKNGDEIALVPTVPGEE